MSRWINPFREDLNFLILWEIFYFRWKIVIYLITHIKGTFLISSQMWQLLKEIRIVLVLILCISEFIQNWFLLLTMKNRRENMYCEISGKIFNILKSYLHESLIPTPMTIQKFSCVVWKYYYYMTNFPKRLSCN